MLYPTSMPSKTPQSTPSQPSEWHDRGLSIGGRGADQFVGEVEKRPKIVVTGSRPAQVLAWLARKDVLNSYLHYQR